MKIFSKVIPHKHSFGDNVYLLDAREAALAEYTVYPGIKEYNLRGKRRCVTCGEWIPVDEYYYVVDWWSNKMICATQSAWDMILQHVGKAEIERWQREHDRGAQTSEGKV